MTIGYELSCRYDNRKSFYNKARVVEEFKDDKQIMNLYSYDSHVATFDGDVLYLYSDADASYTTMRHVREFCLQMGYPEFNADKIREIMGLTDMDIGYPLILKEIE